MTNDPLGYHIAVKPHDGNKAVTSPMSLEMAKGLFDVITTGFVAQAKSAYLRSLADRVIAIEKALYRDDSEIHPLSIFDRE